MICSAKELNISEEHEGIIVLPKSCKVGADFIEEYGNKFLKIELDITPNRPDAFSHYGIARDISVSKDRELYIVNDDVDSMTWLVSLYSDTHSP